MNVVFLAKLKIEKEYQPIADKLYAKLYPNCEIETIDWNVSDENKRIQRLDIDRVIRTEDGRRLKISEKFRGKSNYELRDIFIEIYSNLDQKKPGWALESEADELFYYKNNKVCITDSQKFKKIAEEIKEKFDKIDFSIYRKNTTHRYPIQLKNQWRNGFILVSQPDGQTWATVSYILPLRDLENLIPETKILDI